MISDAVIARWRARSQHLVAPHAGSVVEVVGDLLAVQAENPGQSAWAVACRTSAPSREDLRAALTDGRADPDPRASATWHYARADDVGWLLHLTAPRVRRTTEAQLRGPSGFDTRALERATAAVVAVLEEEPDRTRRQLAASLRDRGVDVDRSSLMILLAHLELGQIVCSGRPADEEHTYALFAQRVPTPRRLDRDEALGELARRYFTGHGPATDATSPTGRRSPSPTCAVGSRSPAIGWRRSTTRAGRSGTPLEHAAPTRRAVRAPAADLR